MGGATSEYASEIHSLLAFKKVRVPLVFRTVDAAKESETVAAALKSRPH